MKELLTGKCKEDFKKWYFREIPKEKSQWNDFVKASLWADFKYASFSMQYGVYVDFFDSVGMRIYLKEIGSIQCCVEFYQYDGDKSWIDKAFDTRQEAQQQAIIKANEIYNAK